MKVLNAQLALLEVNLLVLAVAGVIVGALPLVRGVVEHGDVDVGLRGAPVDAVCGSGKRGSHVGDGAGEA